MRLVLGIDAGTGGCKCIFLDEGGNVAAKGSEEYSPFTKTDGTVEQDPADWYRAAIRVIKRLEAEGKVRLNEVRAAAVTGQMQGVTLIGKDGETVRKSVLWSDTRSRDEAAELNRRHGNTFLRICSMEYSSALTASKIRWIRKHEPEAWERTARFTVGAGYIPFRLCGKVISDTHNIGRTGLNDLNNGGWSGELLEINDIPAEKLPEVHDCFSVAGTVTQKAAAETGLPAGTPVVAGCGDAGAEGYAAGLAFSPRMKIRLGSAASLNIVVPHKTFFDRGCTNGINDVVAGHISLGAYTKSCAQSVKWAREVFFSELPKGPLAYGSMDSEGARSPLGAKNLLFHPYLYGEHAPYYDPSLSAKFHGIHGEHRRGDFVRAIYEGASFSIRDAIESLPAFREPAEYIYIGGGVKSSLWLSILTDVLGRQALLPRECDAAYGAALIAGHAAGCFNARTVIDESLRQARTVTPNLQNHYEYDLIYEKYKLLAGT